MPIDPKIRSGLPLTTPINTTPVPKVSVTPVTAQPVPAAPTGYTTASTFQTNSPKTRGGATDDSLGRTKGKTDDGIGRTRGKTDDGIGRTAGKTDDGIGRTVGKTDDGIGRTAGKTDDGIGALSYEETRAALVGRSDTADAAALRDAINNRLETPTFLKGATSAATQVYEFAKSKLNLSTTQVGQLTTALKGASTGTAKLVGALIEKTPEALTNVDSKGQTLLSNLARFAAQPMNTSLSKDTTKSELMESVLRDIVNPNRIDQGDAPTCTVTSMQFELVAEEPAEYVRLMSDLTGPQGRAKMRGNSELMLHEGDAATRDGRSISQTIFQTAAMEFGNGKNLDFVPSAHGSFDDAGKMLQQGLRPEQQTQVLRQLFGVNYRSERFQTEAEGAKVLEKLRSYDARSAQNRPIILQIDQGDFNHAVTFERVADKKVFFRDPYGELRSMPEDQFKTFVVGMNAPKDANIIS
ncbi:MAG: hypothetical protein JNM17_06420 [Archangium sp.]|nr:hypothetical protein [Archangium sp.]